MSVWVQGPIQDRGVRELGPGVIIGGCDAPVVGTGKWMWVFRKARMCYSLLHRLSAPFFILYSTCKISAGFNRRNKIINDGGGKMKSFLSSGRGHNFPIHFKKQVIACLSEELGKLLEAWKTWVRKQSYSSWGLYPKGWSRPHSEPGSYSDLAA